MRKLSITLFAFVLVIGMCFPQASLSYAADSVASTAASAQSMNMSAADTASMQSTTTASQSSASTASASTSSDTTASSASAITTEDKSAKAASIVASSSVDESQEGSAYAAGEVLVVFKDSADSDSAKQTLADAATVKEGQAEEKQEVTEDTVVARVTDGATVAQAVTELSQNPDVEIVQPNYKYMLMDDGTEEDAATLSDSIQNAMTVQSELAAQAVTINDTSASSQWHLDSVGLYDAWSYSRCSDTAGATGSVGIAIVDSGITATNPDLNDSIVATYDATGETGMADVASHGTHVAGIAAAETNNGIGVAGASYNANIIAIQVFKMENGKASAYSSSLIAAYKYIVQNQSSYNIRVANMSLGGPWTVNSEDTELESWIDKANAAGVLTVCAAGNSDSMTIPGGEWPGDYDTCLSVIALNQDNSKASYSNYNASGVTQTAVNKTKDISAPGTSIYSTLGTGYGTDSGTSMASPLVAGVAALLFAADPSLTPDEAKSVLEGTADDLGSSGWDRYFGYGKVNAYSAIAHVLGTASCSVDGSYTYTGSAITPTVTVKDAEGNTLTQGIDYSVAYADNISVGTATATITAISGSGYYGSTAIAFDIGYPANGVLNGYGTDVLACGSTGRVFTIHTKLASNRLIDIAGRSMEDGGNAQMYAGNETPAQRFILTFTSVGNGYGYYTLKNVYSGKVLDSSGGGTTDGTNVQQYESNGTAAQQWVLSDSGESGYYVISNASSGKVLDISGNSIDNGANLQIYSANGTSAQMFAFDYCRIDSLSESSSYKIENSNDTSYVFDIAGGSTSNGANVQLYKYNSTNAQFYLFSYDENTGYYTIANRGSDKVLDVAGGGTSNGANIWQYTSNSTWAQKWSVKASGSSYIFYSACSGLVADLSGGTVRNGSNIQCYESNGTAAQKWVLAIV